MFGIHDLLLFVLSGLILNVSPGPDTAFIVSRSVQFGWKGGATAALGIGTGILVHVTAAALGISALIATSDNAFTFIKFLGAAYLIYIGGRMLLVGKKNAIVDMRSEIPSVSLSRVFRQGVITNILNPKVALFFLAFLPQFIEVNAPSKMLSFLFLGLIFDVNGTIWNLFVAGIAAHGARMIRSNTRFHEWIERGLGAMFICIGIRLAFVQHR